MHEMKESTYLILTVGLPRSGKSTWALAQGCPVVDTDAVRLAIHGTPWLASAEPLVWGIAKTMVVSLFKAGHPKVILSATSVTAARRREWDRMADKVEWQVFHTMPDECKRRALLTGQDYLIPVIERMAVEWDLYAPWKGGIKNYVDATRDALAENPGISAITFTSVNTWEPKNV
jgi:predicted kinase